MRSQANAAIRIDREGCAARLAEEIELLSAPPFSLDSVAVTRYAFSDAYERTVEHLSGRLAELEFEVRLDAVGNLVARNRPAGTAAIGLGSHCDSVRGGGRYDGILGVLAAIEVAQLGRERGLDLPLQVVSWLEEEGAGFGQLLLGSRIVAGQLDERALREEVRAIDDDRPFWEAAGLTADSVGECRSTLDDMSAWIELHIEQGRVLEDAGQRIGVVETIAGYLHADVEIAGQADHAGATPMELRHDAAVLAAHLVVELERLALETGGGAVATVGELAVEPGIINIIPGQARLSLDIRAPQQEPIDAIAAGTERLLGELTERRGLSATIAERQRVAPTALDTRVIEALTGAAEAAGAPWRPMISGAAHDTMCVATRVPSAMLFIPCRGGVSHSPAEYASPTDAALGVEVLLNAALELS